MIVKRLAFCDGVVPAVEMRRRRPAGHELAIAVAHHTDRNVAVRERGTGDVLGLAELCCGGLYLNLEEVQGLRSVGAEAFRRVQQDLGV